MHYPKRTPEKALGEGKIVNIGFVEDLKKRTQSVYVQGIGNYDPWCPSWMLIKDLKKVVNSFAEGLDKMDIVDATQSDSSKAEACTNKRGGTFETRLENKKVVKDKREWKK